MNLPVRGYSIVEDVRPLAEARGWPIRTLLPERTQIRYASHSIRDEALRLLTHANEWNREHKHYDAQKNSAAGLDYYAVLHSTRKYLMPPTYSVEIPHCSMLGPTGIVVTEAREALLLHEWPHDLHQLRFHVAAYSKQPVFALDPHSLIFTLMNAPTDNYAHWLVDGLPRLATVEPDEPDLRILIQKAAKPYHRESLHMLGFQDDQIIEAVPGYTLYAERLRLVNAAKQMMIPRADYLAWLRERLLCAAGVSQMGGTRRLYVTREGSWRHIANEAELAPVLAQYGFEIVRAQDLSMRDQIRLFAQAQIVMGPHGAGLFNALFAPRGGLLIELINPHYWDPVLVRLASLAGLQHWHCFGETVGEQYATRIAPKAVAETLELALSLQDQQG